MLDYRLETFLTLCQEKNYSKTAKRLSITQPAVTQHIQFLERMYNVKLIEQKNKKVVLTKQGVLLERLARGLYASDRRIYEVLENSKKQEHAMHFGATMTIAEFIMPEIMKRLIQEYPECRCRMLVNNTDTLLEFLKEGKLDFIFIEGNFPKEQYEYRLFSKEEYIAVSGRPMTANSIDQLLDHVLICREEGSGTRTILENLLKNQNLMIDNFQNVIEIGNLKVIKEIVKAGLGISFCYKSSIIEEINNGELCEIPLMNHIVREYNFVYLKNGLFDSHYLEFYEYAKKIYEEVTQQNEV